MLGMESLTIGGRSVYNIRRIEMEEDVFFSGQLDGLGLMLFESQWRRGLHSPLQTVQVFEKGIKCAARCQSFSFDLRFSITDQTLSFFLGEHELTLQMVLGDSAVWRSTLKKYLNQMGFHEQFKPIKKIGKGNFASVYLVEKIEDGKKYAVKAFSKEAAYSEENGKECLVKEIEIMRHLNTSHNMRLSEVFESQNSLYIVFELLEGGQLFQRIKAKEKFKPHQVRKMVQGILEGLKEMHAKNIMHRDLKPQNILLRTENGFDCVIADYGLAEFAGADEYLFVRCGTPGYVAPEVINIKDMKTKYSPVCDIFSLGLIFHVLLFGKSVFKGKTYSEVLSENRACAFDLGSADYEQVDKITMDLLIKMLKINPEERITAEQALCHPYFQEVQMEANQQAEVELAEEMDKVDIGESPLIMTGNAERKQAKDLKRDSCLNFVMGKENILTGKTETVGTVGSAKISGFGAGLLKGLKVSKFVKPSQNKQNEC